GDAARERGRCERGLSGSGDLADHVLSMAKTTVRLWRGRAPSAAALRPAGAPAAAFAPSRAADPRGRDRAGDLGLSAPGGVSRPLVAAVAGAKHCAAAVAAPRPGHPPGAVAGARAPERAPDGAPHRAHPPRAVARPLRHDAPRRGPGAR